MSGHQSWVDMLSDADAQLALKAVVALVALHAVLGRNGNTDEAWIVADEFMAQLASRA
jgi:phosphatidylglycerophosphatase A